ncbi:MAG: diaminopimelate decarboxylase, partial [Bacteroidetes bacterium]|nr:diaminopimelate decarboxylase [Bacteroidota bacterium]
MTETLLKKPQNEALLLQAAERYGTPTYVYEASIVRERIERLRSHLRGAPVQLLYAMKANGALPLLRIMKEEGLGIDAVSPAELELALRIGFEGNQILFSANNMTDDEMDFAAQEGVVLNIGELSRLERFGKKYPGESVCIRFNPQIGAGHHRHVITA